ncbi:hypothetical protein [Thioclava sp. SK-1]|uniref:hypothetical protein n=1 Tax=Thioclava sp. SK-1 TaxID=1889770 RepID=UPI00159F1498|nr:hypothetical protein [Thioclava sp. SK-1]
MIGILLSSLSFVSTRVAGLSVALAIWLLTRPGGWAVLVVLVLVLVKMLPSPPPAPIAL